MRTINVATASAAAGPAAGLRLFTAASPTVSGALDQIIFHDNTTNSLTLTYSSFGLALLPQSASTNTIQAAVFGVPTASLPTSGSATYTGIVSGLATGNTNGTTYLLTGTSSLSANFGTKAYSTTFNFTGKDINGGSSTIAQHSYNGSAGGVTINGSPLYGSLSGSGSGTWIGAFYGPNANEFGYAFNVNGTGFLAATGVAIGKKD